MKALLLSLVLAASPAFAEEPPLRVAVWLQPVGAIWYGIYTGVSGADPLSIYVPLGINIPIREGVELAFEASFFVRQDRCITDRACFSSLGGVLSAGAVFYFSRTSLSGLFVQPKAIFSSFLHEGINRDFDVQVGADVGYAWRFGALYVAPVIGISGGFGLNVQDQLSTPIWLEVHTRGANRPVFGVNLNLLRIGAAF